MQDPVEAFRSAPPPTLELMTPFVPRPTGWAVVAWLTPIGAALVVAVAVHRGVGDFGFWGLAIPWLIAELLLVQHWLKNRRKNQLVARYYAARCHLDMRVAKMLNPFQAIHPDPDVFHRLLELMGYDQFLQARAEMDPLDPDATEDFDAYYDILYRKFVRVGGLMQKFKDVDIVANIVLEDIQEGMTAEMVRLALGDPEKVDESVYRGSKREVWKYESDGKNRFKLKITLDDDKVSGWDKRD